MTGSNPDIAIPPVSTDVPALPPRKADGHKGQFGKVLVLAGSAHYTGAAVLTARAALRAGCGLVTLACPESVHQTISSRLLCEISYPLPDEAPGVFSRDAVSEAIDLTDQVNVAAIGPGITTEQTAMGFARDIGRIAPLPLVIDADGLNAFAGRAGDLAAARAPRVLTPHPGEAARVLGWSLEQVVGDRATAAVALARTTKSIVLMKGAGTLVCDGDRMYRNSTGNDGMATAGSGDVLTGLIAGLLAQGMAPFEAACLGAHLHGLAGDLAAEKLGRYSMLASDILDHLSAAFLRHGA